MTREEIIKEAAADHRDWACCGFDDSIADAQEASFITGAEWEYKRLVEKACKWLKENLFEGYDPDNYPMVRCYNIDLEDFIKEFRREMEE